MGQAIYGATVRPVQAADALVGWINGKGGKPGDIDFDVEWVLALCTDGVVWGKLYLDRWQLSCSVFSHCPPVSTRNLLELRIFGLGGEALLWQGESGLSGRVIVDSQNPCKDCRGCPSIKQPVKDGNPFAPFCQKQVLVGPHYRQDRVGFVHVSNSAGREQVLPVGREELPEGFRSRNKGSSQRSKSPFFTRIKYYLSQEPCGAARVSASRLAKLEVHSSE
jgi:CRISPR-associated protein (TIGR03984 family)